MPLLLLLEAAAHIQCNYPLKHLIIFTLGMCLFTCNSSSLGSSLEIKIVQ
jgi:hypothetical protein